MKKCFTVFLLAFVCIVGSVSAEEEKKEGAQEQRLSIGELRKEARARMAKDAMFYSREERIEIEKLYQSWNTKKGKERQAVAITMLRRFPKSNRTGCAMLYLAQDNARQRRIDLLKQVIRDHGDCWYFNGVQVGAMARYHLICILMETGKQEEAEKYREELKTSFPNAIDHAGKPLIEHLNNEFPAFSLETSKNK